MNEPRGSRILGAVLLVVIIAVVFFGLWAMASMAFVEGGASSGPILFAVGAILLGTVAMATALWLIRHVAARNSGTTAVPPPAADSEPPAA
jgi:RsiW-degrading membrane proteinase PrsW (M82 family)